MFRCDCITLHLKKNNYSRLDNNLWPRSPTATVRLSADRPLQRVPVHQVHVHGGISRSFLKPGPITVSRTALAHRFW